MTATIYSTPASNTPSFHEAIEELRHRFDGRIIAVSDAEYDPARAAWNLLVDQRPALIAVPAGTHDVAEAVRFARRNGLRVAIQATGHGVARPADGALLIVTSELTDVRIDPAARTAYVEAGAKWGAVLAPAQEHGLAPLLGSTTDVGAIGYTLGGGMGWLARRYGLAADSVVAFDLVTPDGIVVRATAVEQPELFWALKGGGAGSLGVVIGMEIELYPVTTVYAGNLLYPVEMAAEVIARWAEWTKSAPAELTSAVNITNFPPIDLVPEPLRGRSFVIVRGCWSGEVAEGERMIDEWRAWRTPALDMFGPLPFAEADTISNDPVDPLPAMVTTEWTNEVTPDVAAILIGATAPAAGQPPLVLFTEIRHAGGAVRDRGVGSVNERGRRDEYLIELCALVMAPEMANAIAGAFAATRGALAPHVTGATYLNFTEGAERQERTASAFDELAAGRIAAVKQALDVDDRFCHGVTVG